MRHARLLLLTLTLLGPASALAANPGEALYHRQVNESKRVLEEQRLKRYRAKAESAEDSGAREGGRPLGKVGAGLLFIAALIVAALLKDWRKDGGRALGPDPARHDPRRQRPEDRTQALRDLRARDPEFDELAFLDEAGRAFVEIHHAWSSGKLDAASRLMSDGTMRRFLVEIALNRHHGRRNVTAGVRLLASKVIAAESDDAFDTLHVRFEAFARERDVPADTSDAEAFGAASRAPERMYEEVWSFVRRRDPGAKAGKLVDGKCPNCGAPAARTAVGNCGYCNAILNSGAHDWVLAEITEADDFFCHPPKKIDGWAELKARDAVVNRQVLEDRASLVFWKWLETQVTGETSRFARLCLPRALERLAACHDAPPRGFSRVVLGDVQLAHVDCSVDRQRAHFVLYWRTAAETWALPRKSVLTLERAAALRTREDTGMATDRCHRCAGFQKELDAVECEWCGALLPQDWAYVDLQPIDEFYELRHALAENAERLADQLEEPADPREIDRRMAAIVAMVRADGRVLESERRLVEECARRWSVPAKRLKLMWSAPVEQLLAIRPSGPEEARALVRGLAAAAYADRGLGADERRLLAEVGAKLGLPAGELKATLEEFAPRTKAA